MNQSSPSRAGTRWLKAILLLSLAALFGFNAWVSQVSNSDLYRSSRVEPEYLEQLRKLKPLNIFQYFAEAAGYRNYGAPGQYTRYFVWLFSFLTIFVLYRTLKLFSSPKTLLAQPVARTNPSAADRQSGKSSERKPATNVPSTHEILCPSCRRVSSVSSIFSGSIRCGCGNIIAIRDGIISLPATPQKKIDLPLSGPRAVEPNGRPPTHVPDVHLGKLEIHFPRRAEELRKHARNGGKLSGPIDKVAGSVWYLSQLWLVFLDGNDFGLTDDREIYDQIVRLANTHPRCSIEHEANMWMHAVATSLTNFEVATALSCSVDSVGQILVLNGNYDETYQNLIRGRVDPVWR